MKNPTVTPAIIATALLGLMPLHAQEKKESAVKTTAYQTSVSQEQLRGATRRLKTEMIGLLDEFSQYQAASGELAKLKEALGQLDTVTEQDMASVVKILREASRMEKPDDTKAKLIEASGEQKEIQALLRSVADRLTLQKDEASIQNRLDQLALRQMANLRDTKAMAETGAKPDKVKGDQQKIQQVNKAEQEALREEVKLAMDTLEKLAEKSDSPAKEAFQQALKTDQENMIRLQAEQSTEKLKTDFTEAVKAQEELLANLKKMAQGLEERKTAEEKSRELAEKVKELAQKQDQLAKNVPQPWETENRKQVKKEQEKISDALELAKDALAKLNPEAASKAEQAKQESEEIAKNLPKKDEQNKADSVAKTADAQKSVAKKLDEVSSMLQKQADQLAGNEPQQNGAEQADSAQADAAQQAISDAVNQVLDAKSQMAMAKRQLQENGDQQNAKQRLDQAQQALDAAQQEVSKAGEAIAKDVSQQLQEGSQNIEKAEQGVGVGSKQDQEKSRWNLDRAQSNADKALQGLQQAANQLASQRAAEKQQTAGQAKPPQQGKGEGENSKSDQAGPAGGKMKTGSETATVSAVAKAQSGQREALSLLQREKAPSEYEKMVEQYIRNLAEGANQ